MRFASAEDRLKKEQDMGWSEEEARQRAQQVDDARILAVIRELSQVLPISGRRWCSAPAILSALCREMGYDPDHAAPGLLDVALERLQEVIERHEELQYAPGG